jgi:tRNA nucleotidyltransferase (CCA-adding enzyme)
LRVALVAARAVDAGAIARNVTEASADKNVAEKIKDAVHQARVASVETALASAQG